MVEPSNLPVKDGELPRDANKVLADTVVTAMVQQFLDHLSRGPDTIIKLPAFEGVNSHQKVSDVAFQLMKESQPLCMAMLGATMLASTKEPPTGLRREAQFALTRLAKAYADVMVACLKDQQLASPRQ